MEDVDMTGVGSEGTQKVQKGQTAPQNQKGDNVEKNEKVIDSDSDDDDPIVCSYDIYIKPRATADRQFVVMQFPNRDSSQPYNEKSESAPLAIRMKPKAGMFEMDVPVDPWHNYDRLKGVVMGDALNKSENLKGAGSHGLASGFSIGAQPASRGRQRTAANEELDPQPLIGNFENSVRNRKVLAKQTLGGQSVPKNGIRPQYMVGVFQGEQLHLTPVDHFVQMRPQFHHIDALAEAAARALPRAVVARPQEARAVHLTAKSSIDGEEENDETMADRIAAVQAEPWNSFRVVDENSDEAWASFYDTMFVGADTGLKSNEELRANIPKLKSVWSNAEYLEAIAPKRQTVKAKDKKLKGKEVAEEDDFDLSNLDDTDSE
ncbi:DNA-directed RNA polymerase III subunit [Lachnellula subtilissima]|uniref:DNA-directed RNA polymerase III subunit n=1 Tax=Lachnellula subtilissima TaxID=602034 RepID=A0A8H8U9B7_9HELO|nr:DNA-directed RNA polymerase III subunit [Lachnellula subtilissima]